ncbi:AraC family transcriptional regulator [Ravibacter arvi]|uniref:AraC family transcriptional regulator n=1 Tax=Ravibacter arvi TaxID=2051041 RepID=A0ABP8LP85_9BACT
MKPILEHLPRSKEQSFVVCDFEYSYYPTPWHYHPEYEIVLVTESSGKRIIGDRVSDFQRGDLVLIGPDLPHVYRNDDAYYDPLSTLRARSVVVHFLEDSFGVGMLALPEMAAIRSLLKRSRFGLEFSGEANRTISKAMIEIIKLSGFERWMKLIYILDTMASADTGEVRRISTAGMAEHHETDEERLQNVLAYLNAHFREEVDLVTVADLAHMTPSAFSRYFKHRTRKTFSEYLLELRTSHAAHLLIRTEQGVGEICYASGFNNLSNFNRHFKAYYQMPPRQFRKQFIQ